MSENVNGTAVQGKGMAVAGFVVAVVAMLLNSVMAGISILSIAAGGSGWLMYLWLVVNILGLVISIMAMGKLKKSGGKRGLAIAGMIVGIVGTVWAIILVLGMAAAASLANAGFNELNDTLNNLDSIDWSEGWEEVE